MKTIKKNKYYLLAFLTPMLIFLIVLLCKGVFLGKTLTTSDLGSQHLPMMEYLRNLLHHKALFPYTLGKGLGGSMYGAFFFTLSNPLNLLVYFFEDVDAFITILIIIKIGLCGLTMFTYLHHQNKYPDLFAYTFSIAYALMGYNITYYVNFMWLDSVIMAPLVLLGIQKIFYHNKDGLYIITLLLTLLLNYYTGYMVTLFSCLYFLYLTYINSDKGHFIKDNYKKIGRFLFITLLIGLMTMFIILPLAYEAMNFTRVDGSIKWVNVNFLSLFASQTIGFSNFVNPLNYYGFLIYAGMVMVPLVVYYFSSSTVSKREKVATFLMYLAFLLPIIIVPLNALWHLFTFPQGFNYRYSFLAILFTLIIALKSFKTMDGNPRSIKLFYIIFTIVSFSLIYVTSKTPEYYLYLTPLKVVATLILLLINCYLVIKKKRNAILVLLVLELVLNLTWVAKESPLANKSKYYSVKDQGKEINSICPNDMRCETTYKNSLNNSLMGNYNGITVFLSSMNRKPIDFLLRVHDIGAESNYTNYNYSDMMLETFLGVKYLAVSQKIIGYDLIKDYKVSDQTIYILKNPYALSLGYTVSSKIKNYQSSLMGFYYLDDILKTLSDTEESYLIKLPIQKVDDKTYEIDKDKKYPYIYIVSLKAPNNLDEDNTYSGDKYGIIYDRSDDKITLTYDDEIDKLEAYSVNLTKLDHFFDGRDRLIIDKQTGNMIEGHIDANSNSPLLTTIPYEKGWTVYVDNKKVTHYEVLDTFIAIDLSKGNHKITLKYEVPGLKVGVFISLFSMAILMGYEIKRRKA